MIFYTQKNSGSPSYVFSLCYAMNTRIYLVIIRTSLSKHEKLYWCRLLGRLVAVRVRPPGRWPPARCARPRAQLIIAVYSSENACAVNMSIGAVLKCAAALSVIWKYMYYASSEAFMQRSLLFCSIGLGSQRPRTQDRLQAAGGNSRLGRMSTRVKGISFPSFQDGSRLFLAFF